MNLLQMQLKLANIIFWIHMKQTISEISYS